MPWSTVVNYIQNGHHERAILVVSIAAWNSWKICLAIKNAHAITKHQTDSHRPYAYAARAESVKIAVRSCLELVLQLAKLLCDFYPYVWDQTSKVLGLKGLTGRAICFLSIACAVHVVEEGVTLIWLELMVPRPVGDTVTTQWIKSLVRTSSSLCVDFLNYRYHSREAVMALDLSWMLINMYFIQPWRYLKNQLPDAVLPEAIKAKADYVSFPKDNIKVGAGDEPRAHHFRIFSVDFIIINEELLEVLSESEAAAIFCRELGHWDLHHAHIRNFLAVLELLLGGLPLLTSLAEPAARLFRVDPEAPAVVHVFLIKFFVSSMIRGFIRGLVGFVNVGLELQADEYAAHVNRASSRTSLLVQGTKWRLLLDAWGKLVEVDSDNYQFFDDSFAAFFHGQPTFHYRLNRYAKRLTFSSSIDLQRTPPSSTTFPNGST